MDSPADQKVAQTQPSLKLKQKLKPLQLAQQLAEYVDKLPPVNFSFYDDSPRNPYSLPGETGAVFVQEGLLKENGQTDFANMARLNDAGFSRRLKNKICFVLINSFIKNSIFANLSNGFDDPVFMPANLHGPWSAYAEFMADYYAPQATTFFFRERYPDRLTNAKTVSRLPLKHVNKQVKNSIALRLKKDKNKIIKTVSFFLAPHQSIPAKKKKSLLMQAADLTANVITASSEYYFDIDIQIDANRFPLFDVTYTQEV